MQKQLFSKDDLQAYGKEFSDLVREIHDLSQHNQEMLNSKDQLTSQQNNRIFKKIQPLIQKLKKINKKHHHNLFCSLLSQIQVIKSENKITQVTLLSKLTKSLMIFLKTNENIRKHGNFVWQIIKYFFWYQQQMKSKLAQFKKDFEQIERLKEFFAKKFEHPISDSLRKIKEENSGINKLIFNQNWKSIYKLKKKFLSISNERANIEQLNQSIEELLRIVPANVSQQIQLNNFKQEYEKELTKFKNKKLPCCSVYFHRNEKIDLNSHRYNDYEEVRIPLNLQSQKTIRKIMISFLNTDGGIHYIGIKKEQSKLNVQGIWMNETQMVNFFTKLYEIVHQVYPDNEIKLKKFPTISSNTYLLELSRFVSVQINPLIDKEHGHIDYLEMSHDKKTDHVYVIKIKVKAAPKYDTYMVKDQSSSIQSYRRNNGVIEKIKPSQFPKVFTQRSLTYINDDTPPGNPQCPNCRHSYVVGSD